MIALIQPSRSLKKTPDKSRNNYVLRRLNRVDAYFSMSNVWGGQEPAARAVASESVRIITEAYEKAASFFGSKSKEWVLGGLFYLLGQRGVSKTQKQIARCLDTSQMTIRNSYQDWDAFPNSGLKPQHV